MCTATTRLITHHISKGESVAQSLKDRFDYGQNPEKTGGGELISSYACDHQTADAEFLLSKAKYRAVTGREQRRDADGRNDQSVFHDWFLPFVFLSGAAVISRRQSAGRAAETPPGPRPCRAR